MRKWHRGARQITGLVLSATLTVLVTGCGGADTDEGQNGSQALGTASGDMDAQGPSGAVGTMAVKMEDSDGGASGAGTAPEQTSDSAVVLADKEENEVKADVACAVTDFGVRLLQHGIEVAGTVFPAYASMPKEVYDEVSSGGNQLYSPLSVLCALGMTANGAQGETLQQMESVFGVSAPELTAYLSAYEKALPAADEYKLHMANGIWLTEDERFTVEEDFLQNNEELFGAGVRRAPFDGSTLQEINGWVKDNTDGMIPKILDEIPPDGVMYLVNALAFDARWQKVYHEYQVREGDFTEANGAVQKTQMMYSTESWYLEGEDAEGLLKYYADEKYAFAALLPREGMTVAEYAASLTGEKLRKILTNPVEAEVDAAIPKFQSEYGIELGDILQQMGMEDAFDPYAADFSGIGRSTLGNIFISRVLHKTFIAVDESGTKAGAATAVEIKDECAALETGEVKQVHLDRPFLYLIIDCEERLPLFIGTVTQIGE